MTFVLSVVGNDEMESYLGLVNDTPSKARALILRNNKIKTRYYALDKNSNPTHTNAQITAKAVEGLFDENFKKEDMERLDTLMPMMQTGEHEKLPPHGPKAE